MRSLALLHYKKGYREVWKRIKYHFGIGKETEAIDTVLVLKNLKQYPTLNI